MSEDSTVVLVQSDFKRLPPGSKNKPIWAQNQTDEQRLAITLQVKQMRKYLPYKSFNNLTCGSPERNYQDALYHIGQLYSNSYFITYTFRPSQMTIDKLYQFIQNIFNCSFLMIGQNGNKFFVMTVTNVPVPIVLFKIKHPSQTKACTRVTWKIDHLSRWIKNNSVQCKQIGELKQSDYLDDSSLNENISLFNQQDIEQTKNVCQLIKSINEHDVFDVTELVKFLQTIHIIFMKKK